MIAIIGGGPGGLTLARILHVHGIDSVAYERDAGPEARSQGSMLDLHTDTGQAALRAAGVQSEMELPLASSGLPNCNKRERLPTQRWKRL